MWILLRCLLIIVFVFGFLFCLRDLCLNWLLFALILGMTLLVCLGMFVMVVGLLCGCLDAWFGLCFVLVDFVVCFVVGFGILGCLLAMSDGLLISFGLIWDLYWCLCSLLALLLVFFCMFTWRGLDVL